MIEILSFILSSLLPFWSRVSYMAYHKTGCCTERPVRVVNSPASNSGVPGFKPLSEDQQS